MRAANPFEQLLPSPENVIIVIENRGNMKQCTFNVSFEIVSVKVLKVSDLYKFWRRYFACESQSGMDQNVSDIPKGSTPVLRTSSVFVVTIRSSVTSKHTC